MKVGMFQPRSRFATAAVTTTTAAEPPIASSQVDRYSGPRNTARPMATRQPLNPSRPAAIRALSTRNKYAVPVATAAPSSPNAPYRQPAEKIAATKNAEHSNVDMKSTWAIPRRTSAANLIGGDAIIVRAVGPLANILGSQFLATLRNAAELNTLPPDPVILLAGRAIGTTWIGSR
ncbi:hypothetical protein GCM10027521_45100 [Amycolatopsis cihanbeyliensis]